MAEWRARHLYQAPLSMSITWRLHHPMPAELFEEMKVAAE